MGRREETGVGACEDDEASAIGREESKKRRRRTLGVELATERRAFAERV
ncbi:MAG: hypothetical protein J6K20_02645 [Thermoguttaceae bacterium]|nr:hypothetical protein [Thermoguttaceae bacterium]